MGDISKKQIVHQLKAKNLIILNHPYIKTIDQLTVCYRISYVLVSKHKKESNKFSPFMQGFILLKGHVCLSIMYM